MSKLDILSLIAKFIIFIIKVIIGYYFLGMIAIFIFSVCIGILDVITICSTTDFDLVKIISNINGICIEEYGRRIYSVFRNDFPFGEILADVIEGNAGTGNIYDIVLCLLKGEFTQSFKEHYESVFPSISVVCISNFFAWFFCRINVVISKFLSGRTFDIVTVIPMAIFGVTSFFIAIIIKKIIEIIVPKQFFLIALFIVAVLFFFLHITVLKKKDKWQNVFVHLVFSLFDGIIGSFLAWGICFTIGRFFDTKSFMAVYMALLQYILIYGFFLCLHGKFLQLRLFK